MRADASAGADSLAAFPKNALKARRAKIHDADKRAKLHCAHENQAVLRLYEEMLGEPGSAESHELLHRHYINREVR